MSVQDLRDKFSRNGGTVAPPGLSYADGPAAAQHRTPQPHNGKPRPHRNGPGGGRFKTIREEPADGAAQQQQQDVKPPARNDNSFLQTYQRQAAASTTAPKFTPSKFVPSAAVKTTSAQPAAVKTTSPQPAAVKTTSPTSAFVVTSPPPVLNGGGGGVDKWRAKYDETENRRKSLLTQSQKLLREKTDTERVMAKLRLDLETSNEELSQRTLQLSQLRKLSEAMYVEYDKLKKKYELETGTLEKAMERASQWYKQNRELKRRSSALMQKVMSVAPSSVDDLTDDPDGGGGGGNNNGGVGGSFGNKWRSVVAATVLLAVLQTAPSSGVVKRCFSCRSRGELGSCKDRFRYVNVTQISAEPGVSVEAVPCASGWCGKIVETRNSDAKEQEFDTATQRTCLQRGPSDNEERCDDTVWEYKKVFMCFCHGDLCNGTPRPSTAGSGPRVLFAITAALFSLLIGGPRAT